MVRCAGINNCKCNKRAFYNIKGFKPKYCKLCKSFVLVYRKTM